MARLLGNLPLARTISLLCITLLCLYCGGKSGWYQTREDDSTTSRESREKTVHPVMDLVSSLRKRAHVIPWDSKPKSLEDKNENQERKGMSVSRKMFKAGRNDHMGRGSHSSVVKKVGNLFAPPDIQQRQPVIPNPAANGAKVVPGEDFQQRLGVGQAGQAAQTGQAAGPPPGQVFQTGRGSYSLMINTGGAYIPSETRGAPITGVTAMNLQKRPPLVALPQSTGTAAPTMPTQPGPTNPPIPMATPVPTVMTPSPTARPTFAPVPGATTAFPTASPINVQTQAPTPMVDGGGGGATTVGNIIAGVALQGGNEFTDGSPQKRALDWAEQNLSVDGNTAEEIIEYYALTTIFFATDNLVNKWVNATAVQGWANKTGWLDVSFRDGQEDPGRCSWYGIICANGRVDTITLFNNFLTGTLPDEIKLLSDTLKILDLEANAFETNGQSWIGGLVNLEVLNMNTNFVEYPGIPPSIALLSKLVVLRLQTNVLVGSFDGSLFSNMPALEVLDISSNDFLSSAVPNQIGNLPSLKEFYAANANLGGNLDFLKQPFKTLEILDISGNPFQSASIPAEVGDLPVLREFYAFGAGLTGPLGFLTQSLPELLVVDISQNNFQSPIPSQITAPKLQQFLATDAQLTGSLDVFPSLPTLQVLDISANSFNSAVPSLLGTMPNLSEIYAYQADIRGTLDFLSGGLPSITRIEMFGNPQLGGGIPTTIGALNTLTYLDVGECNLSGPIPSQLGQLNNLAFFVVFNNALSGEIPVQLGNLQSIVVMALEYNNIVGPMPAGVCTNKNANQGFLSSDCNDKVQCSDDCCDCCNNECLQNGA